MADLFGGPSGDPEPLAIAPQSTEPITPDASELARRRQAALRRRRAISSLRIDDSDSGTGLSIGGQ